MTELATATPGDRPSIQMGKYTLTFENIELDAEGKEKARLELRETPEVVQAALQELRDMLKNEPTLNYPIDEDLQLQVFLRPCKYYASSAFERMRKFYKFKLNHPKYCNNLTPSCEKRAFMSNLITILPERSTNGERIVLLEAGKKWDPKTCTLVEIFRSIMLILEAAVAEPKTQVSGVQVILDVAGLSLQHVWQFSASFAKHVVEWVQECVPIRLKAIHVVNQPYIFNMVFAIFKPFLGEKLKQRIHFHGSNYNNLQNSIPPSILPLQYGGSEDIPLDIGSGLHKYLMCFEKEFTERSKCGYSS